MFEERYSLHELSDINWDAVQNDGWGYQGVDPSVREGKQAEFLLERRLPWELVQRIGCYSKSIRDQVRATMERVDYKPMVEVCKEWYY